MTTHQELRDSMSRLQDFPSPPNDMKTIVNPPDPVVDLDYRHQEICAECGVYPADHKGVCEGCLAYREHQA